MKHISRKKREIDRWWKKTGGGPFFTSTGYYNNRPWLLERMGNEIGSVENIRFVQIPI